MQPQSAIGQPQQFRSVQPQQFRSVQSLDLLGRRRDLRNASTEILFQSFLQKAIVRSSGKGRDVHSLMLSIRHFLCRPRRLPSSKGALKGGLGAEGIFFIFFIAGCVSLHTVKGLADACSHNVQQPSNILCLASHR